MKNAAGDQNCNEYLTGELLAAGIAVVPFLDNKREVPATIKGKLGSWTFERAWYYWVARGNHIPFEVADKLHEAHGKDVRVCGHCGCPSPREWYDGIRHEPGVPLYHVDTQEGLNALADAIRKAEKL
jgi:hypothetical protein